MVNVDAQLTDLIRRMQDGDRAAGESVFSACAARLRRMSSALMAKERCTGFHASDLLQETLVQKVTGNRLKARVASREHFFSLIAAGMRQVLTDRGRSRSAQKRQAPAVEELLGALRPAANPHLADLSLGLQRLEQLDPQGRDLIRYKFEHGLTWDELAEVTGRPVGQLRAECDYVVGWLREQLR